MKIDRFSLRGQRPVGSEQDGARLYLIQHSHYGRGLAGSGVIEYLFFEVGFNRIQAIYHTDNPVSGKVMLKAGMKYEGRLRNYHINNKGTFIDCVMYAILREDMKIG